MLNQCKCLLVFSMFWYGASYKCYFQGDEDKGADAFKLFKLCHYSKKKKGYTPAVQVAIVRQLSNDAFYYAYFQLSHDMNHVCCLFLIDWYARLLLFPSPRFRAQIVNLLLLICSEQLEFLLTYRNSMCMIHKQIVCCLWYMNTIYWTYFQITTEHLTSSLHINVSLKFYGCKFSVDGIFSSFRFSCT